MRVMLDTNILISAVLFPGKSMDQFIQKISSEHQIVLSSYVIDEFKGVVKERFPDKLDAIDKFFAKMSYELVYTPEDIPDDMFEIRDKKDYPVLFTAVNESVDVLVTGDKDFTDVNGVNLEICTPQIFLEKYVGFHVSENTLKMMDYSIENYKAGIVSEAITDDLSYFLKTQSCATYCDTL